MTQPHGSPEVEYENQLADLRQSIDNIDAALIHLLAERTRATKRVGYLKADHGKEASDPAREARQTTRIRSLAEAAGMDPDFAERFQQFVVTEAVRNHKLIAQEIAQGLVTEVAD